jgi:hypothetical protein
MEQSGIGGLSIVQWIGLTNLVLIVVLIGQSWAHSRSMAGIAARMATIDRSKELKDTIEPLATSVPGQVVSEIVGHVFAVLRLVVKDPDALNALASAEHFRQEVSDSKPNVEQPPEVGASAPPFKLPGDVAS